MKTENDTLAHSCTLPKVQTMLFSEGCIADRRPNAHYSSVVVAHSVSADEMMRVHWYYHKEVVFAAANKYRFKSRNKYRYAYR